MADRWHVITAWADVWQTSAGDRLSFYTLTARGRFYDEVGQPRLADEMYAEAVALAGCTPTEVDDIRREHELGHSSRTHRSALVGAMLDGCNRDAVHVYR